MYVLLRVRNTDPGLIKFGLRSLKNIPVDLPIILGLYPWAADEING